MKRNKMTLLVTVFFVAIIVFWAMVRVPNKDSPKKLSSIPDSAVWRGGVDEGFWFELVEVYSSSNDKVRVRIYNDYNGGMVLDADFIGISDCNIKEEEFIEKINYFEFKKIVLLDGCEFNAIYPAYGGCFWEIDKESE